MVLRQVRQLLPAFSVIKLTPKTLRPQLVGGHERLDERRRAGPRPLIVELVPQDPDEAAVARRHLEERVGPDEPVRERDDPLLQVDGPLLHPHDLRLDLRSDANQREDIC